MKLLLFVSLMIPSLLSAQEEKIERIKIGRKDSVYICFINTKTNKYVQNGTCHSTLKCKDLINCRGKIEKKTYFQAVRTLKCRHCDICCKP